MYRFTRLDAVNRMLRAAGEAPVNSLSDDGLNDTSIAEDLLDETSIEVQLEGFLANRQIEVRNIDSEGKIRLPENCLRVESAGEQGGRILSMRGSTPPLLWDNDNNTDVFTESMELQMILGLEFTDLPPDMQFYVVDNAAQLYQAVTLGDKNVDGVLGAVAAQSRMRARANDIRARKLNIFTRTRNAAAAVSRNVRLRLDGT